MRVAGKGAWTSVARTTLVAVLVGSGVMGCNLGNNGGGVTPGPPPSAGTEFVFIPDALIAPNVANNVMSVLQISSSGVFNAGPVPLVQTGNEPVWAVVDPTNHFVYVANLFDNTVSAFTLNTTTGAMAVVPGSPFLAGTAPGAVAVDPSGKFLYVANDGSSTVPGSVSGFKINSDGSLTQVPGSPIAAGSQPQQGIAVTAGFVYVSNQLSNDVSVYSFDPGTGALTQTAFSPVPLAGGVGPESLAMDPAGKFLFTANMTNNTVSAFTVNANGSLTQASGSPFGAGAGFSLLSSPQYLVTDRTGAFLYVVSVGTPGVTTGTVTTYTIASNGVLTQLGAPLSTGNDPEGLAVDAANKFLLVANCFDGTLSVFSISNGSLTAPGTFGLGNVGCPQAVATTH
jgi:6-phosphogluconolactonase